MTVRQQSMTRRGFLDPSSPCSVGIAAFVCCLVLAGCNKDGAAAGGGESEPAAKTTVVGEPSADPAHSNKGHNPAHPPIDCPLRKQGIDPSKMRPFEDVERYIAFLDREDRADWQRPDEVIAALHLTGSETVLDIGAGSGYFAFRFAEALPRGKVIAADIEPEMVRHIHHKAMTTGAKNVEALLIKADMPSVPTAVDLIFICDVLHHVADRPAWLGRIVKTMQAGARLLLIEFKEGDLPEGPPESMKIPRDRLVKLATDAGLVLADEQPKLLPYQTFLVFKKP